VDQGFVDALYLVNPDGGGVFIGKDEGGMDIVTRHRPRKRPRYRGDNGCFGGWDVRQWWFGTGVRARVRSSNKGR
jgi:hypothetical protein